MFTTSKRKEELLKLKKENENLRHEIMKLETKLVRARMTINDISIKIGHDISNKSYTEIEKSLILYQLLALNNNDMNSIKRFHAWVLPKDEI